MGTSDQAILRRLRHDVVQRDPHLQAVELLDHPLGTADPTLPRLDQVGGQITVPRIHVVTQQVRGPVLIVAR